MKNVNEENDAVFYISYLLLFSLKVKLQLETYIIHLKVYIF